MARQSALWVPERAEIIWIAHSPHAGKEMKNEHPMLVISPVAFNARTGIVIGLPMTHAEYNADNPFALAVKGPKGEVGYVLAFQPKSFDWKERGGRPHPWGAGHTKVLGAALKKLDAICGICEH
ncbi:type II toxin-antitoxin system PemK/MazF family toxin [Variovorax sp. J22R133]|uniref:type II toxin-antitoxin system PemK/MazF family toxin n=1 Tax=Variovorax brevis TaxID=3053503 RepID=UPI00257587BE|nr:type II toxin-antitoxin system PemK/MazF family toxin [Variovorax sp. J22R133]MDM0111411.1 type II toxin-antitoxin system PemK/MazF family toxin [Variovorax sp. J22R133]